MLFFVQKTKIVSSRKFSEDKFNLVDDDDGGEET